MTIPAQGWRESSHSMSNGNCLEAAATGAAVHVRDTVDREGPVLAFTSRAWVGLTRQIKTENRAYKRAA